MTPNRNNYYCIIMAGGIGSRFWPVSRNEKPKQFLDILGVGRSFLQQTFDRFAKVIPVENILVVTSDLYSDLVAEQIPEIKREHILAEPFRRNTAPCVAYAMYKLMSKDPNAVAVVAPSDHLITNEEIFTDTVINALDFVKEHDLLMTLGIEPTRPETAYGYIQSNMANFFKVNDNTIYEVKTFTEKPNAELAKVFLDSGEFLWNSGIFFWNAKTITQELEKFQPDIASLFKQGNDLYYTPKEADFVKDVYENCSIISIDYGVMEKTDKAAVYPVSFGWSDMGTWESFYSQVNKDDKSNYINHRKVVMADKVSNSIIYTTDKDKLIVVNNLDGYMIVNTDDVVLICPRDESAFKMMLANLSIKELNKYL